MSAEGSLPREGGGSGQAAGAKASLPREGGGSGQAAGAKASLPRGGGGSGQAGGARAGLWVDSLWTSPNPPGWPLYGCSVPDLATSCAGAGGPPRSPNLGPRRNAQAYL